MKLFTLFFLLLFFLIKCNEESDREENLQLITRKLEWWQTEVIYQIYTKSFRDSNGDGIGDLRGIIEKIDYLESIGVKIIWLNPIYLSGGLDGGYDIISFVEIDPVYGTMDDFDELIEKLHKKNMYLIMDFIPNHTSIKHPWFIESCKNNSQDNYYADYYVWTNVSHNKPPNNWHSVFGNSSWEFHPKRKEWYFHQFLPQQPDLNFRSEKVLKEINDTLIYWLEKKKVDGLRVDAMNFLFEDELMRDEPLQVDKSIASSGNTYHLYDHVYTYGQKETLELNLVWNGLLKEISSRESRKKCLFIEVYDTLNVTMQYYGIHGLKGACFPFNFQFLRFFTEDTTRYHMWNFSFQPKDIKSLMDPWFYHLPKDAWSNWLLGNHDSIRIASRIGRENIDLANALVTLIGGTCITYYGEEIGMEDLPLEMIEYEDMHDSFGRLYGPELFWRFSRDYQRSPMQWNSNLQTSAGFTLSNAKPWLPLHPKYNQINVLKQLTQAKSHLSIYKDLVRLRRLPQFQYGHFEYAIVDNFIFSFYRRVLHDMLSLVILNMSNHTVAYDFYKLQNMTKNAIVAYSCCTSNGPYDIGNIIETQNIVLKPKSFLVLHRLI